MVPLSAELRALAAHASRALLDPAARGLLAPAGEDGQRHVLVRLASEQLRETGTAVEACGGVATVIVPRRQEVVALTWDARDVLARPYAPRAPWTISAATQLGDLRDYALLGGEPLTYRFDALAEAVISAEVLLRTEGGPATRPPAPRTQDDTDR
jgi:hypothetical protein